jgi:FAD dependent oxidoreductase TIGR03364
MKERCCRKGSWKEIADESGLWYEESGSLHLAYNKHEWNVLAELAEIYKDRNYELLHASDAARRSQAIVGEGLLGGLYSPDELIIDPRSAIAAIPQWLEEKYGVRFIWGKTVTDICYPAAYIGSDLLQADEIYVCSGPDLETLYPNVFVEIPITKCKLQMMRMAPQPCNWRIGPSLCGGLSLVHYNSFKAAPSLSVLKKYFEENYPEHLQLGIHVMVSQNGNGELTIGDSHEYGSTHDPFDRQRINNLILDYLKKFAHFKDETITETWSGIYPKLTNGQTELVLQPEQGVTIINALGGAGMTLSFGLCEQLINKPVTFTYHTN